MGVVAGKKAPIVPIPQVAAAQVAGEQAQSIGQAIVKTATTPFYHREKTERWDPETETWVPLERTKELNVSPAAVGGAALAVAGAAFVLGLGAAPVEKEEPILERQSNPAYEAWAANRGLPVDAGYTAADSPPRTVDVQVGTKKKVRLALVARPRSVLSGPIGSGSVVEAAKGELVEGATWVFGPTRLLRLLSRGLR